MIYKVDNTPHSVSGRRGDKMYTQELMPDYAICEEVWGEPNWESHETWEVHGLLGLSDLQMFHQKVV